MLTFFLSQGSQALPAGLVPPAGFFLWAKMNMGPPLFG
jgi:hypothetical protein